MKKFVSVILCVCLMLASTVSFASFDDVDSGTASWAGDAIESLASKNIINGYPDGTFCPGGNVTRAEIAKMISVAFEPVAKGSDYDDVSGHWAQEYIKNVKMYTNGNLFNPDEYATRADVAYAVVNALEKGAATDDALNGFPDCDTLDGEMKSALGVAVEAGIIKGYEDATVRPFGNVTRAEAAVIIYRSLGIKEEIVASDANDAVASNGDNTAEDALPNEDETPAEKEDAPAQDAETEENTTEGSTTEENTAENDDRHIYTLNPGEDLLLVSAVSATSSQNGEESYRISYRLGNGEDEYSSVIPADTEVVGIKTSVSELRPGDVMLMNTNFHGYISNLQVLASFGGSSPTFNLDAYSYKKGKYVLEFGKIISVNFTGKTASLVVERRDGQATLFVMKNTPVNVFSSWKKNNNWALEAIDFADPEEEEVYVYIRYTNGVSTEVVLSDMVR